MTHAPFKYRNRNLILNDPQCLKLKLEALFECTKLILHTGTYVSFPLKLNKKNEIQGETFVF